MAIASRDYQDVHHDAELAREKGSPDIFMNIFTTNGLVGRYITDHFGPAAVLRKVAIRLGAPKPWPSRPSVPPSTTPASPPADVDGLVTFTMGTSPEIAVAQAGRAGRRSR
ncbi:hypothetical protein [Streptomyces sp. EN23]|uniref:hypothetical protein n=1 Tax=Streptomyces sp. EN23 TaxID=212774 RepID=UPI0008515915|nr:hypothetical protein [Streptomyces sp. EN23]